MLLEKTAVPDQWKSNLTLDASDAIAVALHNRQHAIEVSRELMNDPKVSPEDQAMYRRFFDRRFYWN
jgi:hypothetical protein